LLISFSVDDMMKNDDYNRNTSIDIDVNVEKMTG